MMGTRAGVHTLGGEPRGAIPILCCYRCGIKWMDSSSRYMPGAPCPDCREMLTEQMSVKNWYWKRPRAGQLAPCEVDDIAARERSRQRPSNGLAVPVR